MPDETTYDAFDDYIPGDGGEEVVGIRAEIQDFASEKAKEIADAVLGMREQLSALRDEHKETIADVISKPIDGAALRTRQALLGSTWKAQGRDEKGQFTSGVEASAAGILRADVGTAFAGPVRGMMEGFFGEEDAERRIENVKKFFNTNVNPRNSSLLRGMRMLKGAFSDDDIVKRREHIQNFHNHLNESFTRIGASLQNFARRWTRTLTTPIRQLRRFGRLLRRFRGWILGLGTALLGFLGIRSFTQYVRDAWREVRELETQLKDLANLTGSDAWAEATVEWARSLRRELGLSVDKSIELSKALAQIGIDASSTDLMGILAAQQATGISGSQITGAVRSPESFMGLFDQLQGQVPFFALAEILGSTGPFDYEERLKRLNELLLVTFGDTLERGKNTVASLQEQIKMMMTEVRESLMGSPNDPTSLYSWLRTVVQNFRNFIRSNFENLRTFTRAIGDVMRAVGENFILFWKNTFQSFGVMLDGSADKFRDFNNNILLPFTGRLIQLTVAIREYAEGAVQALADLLGDRTRLDQWMDRLGFFAVLAGVLGRRPLWIAAGLASLGYNIDPNEGEVGFSLDNMFGGFMVTLNELMAPKYTGLWAAASLMAFATGNPILGSAFGAIALASGIQSIGARMGIKYFEEVQSDRSSLMGQGMRRVREAGEKTGRIENIVNQLEEGEDGSLSQWDAHSLFRELEHQMGIDPFTLAGSDTFRAVGSAAEFAIRGEISGDYGKTLARARRILREQRLREGQAEMDFRQTYGDLADPDNRARFEADYDLANPDKAGNAAYYADQALNVGGQYSVQQLGILAESLDRNMTQFTEALNKFGDEMNSPYRVVVVENPTIGESPAGTHLRVIDTTAAISESMDGANKTSASTTSGIHRE